MGEIGRDLRQAFRVFKRNPGFAAIIVITLGLGIGANSAIFSAVNGVLLQPLPFDPDGELVRLRQGPLNAQGQPGNLSPYEISDFRERASTLAGVVEYHTMFFNLIEDGQEPERVQTGVVSWDYFDVLGIPPIHGRTFNPEEDHVDADPVLVLGYDYWQRRFGGDPEVIGRMVEMNNRQHEIVGVLPSIPTYPNQNEVWMPWYACPFRVADNWNLNRQMRMLVTIGRVATGAAPERVDAEIGRIAQDLMAEFPGDYPNVETVGASAVPLMDELTSGARTTFLILLGMSGMVLLIACANVANLTLARMNNRQQEMAIRSAMGAGRGRIVRLLVAESLVLSVAGALLATAVAYLSVDALATFANGLTPRFEEVRVDGWVLAFTGLIAVATGLLVGGGPGLLVSRMAGRLRESKGSVGVGGQRLRSGLVVSQVAVAFVLLVGSGLMIRSFQNLLAVDPGYSSDGVLTVTVDLDWAKYTTAEDSRQFYRGLLDRINERPQVMAAGLASDFPMSGNTFQSQTGLLVEGETLEGDRQPPRVNQRFVSEGYFEALGLALVQGRFFERSDDTDGAPVAVLSRSAAQRFFGEDDPIGRRISPDGGQNWATVIGVAGDVRQFGLESDVNEEVYFPYFQGAGFVRRILVRTSGPPEALARPVTDDVYTIDPNQPVSFVQTLTEAEAATVASPRTVTLLLSIFAGIALITAAAGILSVIAYSVSQRQREIGIRMALGAERQTVVAMVLRGGLTKVALGLVAGGVAAFLLGDLIQGLLFGLDAGDPVTFAAVAATLFGVAIAATWIPAARGTRVDPMVAFRSE